jgi:hypothetical protein
MALTKEQAQGVLNDLVNRIGLPAGYQGDRLAALGLGIQQAVEALAPRVTLDAPAAAPNATPAVAKSDD